MMTEKIYTLECYQYNTDKKRTVTVHAGELSSVRDGLTPVMIWTREYFARNKKHAEQKGRKVARALNYKFVR